MSLQRVFITGASSGIGWALAEALAAPGVTLGLAARRRDRLNALVQQVAKKGGTALPYGVDVCDRDATARAVRAFAERAEGLDTVIANAGISRSDDLRDGDATATSELLAVNLQGTLHTLLPAVPILRAQGGGALVAIGSVAGFRGLPGKGAYCASKAALKTLMDAWRPDLRSDGIQVTTICPGWVHSELTQQNAYRMPFIMEAPRAAQHILRAIRAGRSTYVFPWQMRLVVPLMRHVPDWMLPSLATRR